MKARWFAPALLLADRDGPAQAQFAIDITVGPNWSSISEVPAGAPAGSTESDIGYFLGGQIRFGHMFYVAPGLDYQYQSFKVDEGTRAQSSDNIGLSSFMIPLEVGVNLEREDRRGAARRCPYRGVQHLGQRQRVWCQQG